MFMDLRFRGTDTSPTFKKPSKSDKLTAWAYYIPPYFKEYTRRDRQAVVYLSLELAHITCIRINV